MAAGVTLFARRGFGGTGVREIAAEAGVNLSSVGYYFGSKLGLLQAVIDDTFERYAELVRRCFGGDGTVEERVRRYYRELVQLMRARHDQFRITLSELHHETPELAEHRAETLKALVLPEAMPFVSAATRAAPRELTPDIVGPLLPALAWMHFMFEPVHQRVSGVAHDDAFHDQLADQLASFALHGLTGSPDA